MSSYLKSPFNYVGGKYSLLPQLMPLLPSNVDIFVDVFGGGFNVGLNSHAGRVVYNDIVTPIVELWKYWYTHDKKRIIKYVEDTIQKNFLSREEKDFFNLFRERYNTSKSKCPLDLYILMCYSYNYQFRFNKDGLYNSSHGTNRSSFTTNMRSRLLSTLEWLDTHDVVFYNMDFELLIQKLLNEEILSECSLVYMDPPYFIGIGNYNDGSRGYCKWTKQDEERLYKTIDVLNENKISFALSNITHHKNKESTHLLEWLEKNDYNIHYMTKNYNNCSYNTRKTNTTEVLITNYKNTKKKRGVQARLI